MKLTLLTLAVLASWTVAHPQTSEYNVPPSPCPTTGPPSKADMIRALDNNGDDKLSPAEARMCNDCRLKCFCNGMKHAFNLEENSPDYDGDGLFDASEVPDPPDDAPYLPSDPPSSRQILRTVDTDEDNHLSKKELRNCKRKFCHLQCPCTQMLESFDDRAGDDNLLSIDEFYNPGPACPGERNTVHEENNKK